MRINLKPSLFAACAAVALFTFGCGDDGEGDGDEAGETAGTDEAGTTTGDGDTGDSGSTTGDTGESTGDTGPGDTGDTGPGDTGPGDTGDTGPGDTGPGDTGDTGGNAACADYGTEDECVADDACQAVLGQPLKQNGPDSPCLEPSEYLGCIAQQGCGDALTWFCVGNNAMFLVPDTCGPDNGETCDGPADVGECP